jgi:DNA-binding response OmpR family regulator
MRLLVVEDDATLRKFLALILQEEGFLVDTAARADDGRVLALTNDYDGIIVDLKLPDGHGTDVVRAIRREGRRVPILMFTANMDREEIVAALDAGADDYLIKPTDADIIRARVRALVRRGQRDEQSLVGGPMLVGNISLSVPSRRVLVGGTPLQLTPKEILLLQHLLMHVGAVVQRSELLEKVWDMHFDPESNVIDSHVSRLRTKLRKAGANVSITGVRGTGFLLEVEAAE